MSSGLAVQGQRQPPSAQGYGQMLMYVRSISWRDLLFHAAACHVGGLALCSLLRLLGSSCAGCGLDTG